MLPNSLQKRGAGLHFHQSYGRSHCSTASVALGIILSISCQFDWQRGKRCALFICIWFLMRFNIKTIFLMRQWHISWFFRLQNLLRQWSKVTMKEGLIPVLTLLFWTCCRNRLLVEWGMWTHKNWIFQWLKRL